jgi:hypothetical protein
LSKLQAAHTPAIRNRAGLIWKTEQTSGLNAVALEAANSEILIRRESK